MKVEWVSLGEILELEQNPEVVRIGESYRCAGLLNRGRGLFDKGILDGADTKYHRLYRLSRGQLVYSKLFGWEGAIALVPDAFHGYHVSSEFPTFAPDGTRVASGYLAQYLKSGEFTVQMARSTNGLGQRRQRVNVDSFLRIMIPLPPRPIQDRIANHLFALNLPQSDGGLQRGFKVGHIVSRVSTNVMRVPIGQLMRSSRPWIDVDADGSYRPIGVRGFGRGMIRYPETPATDLSKLQYARVQPDALIISNIKAWEGAVCLAENSDAARIASNRFLQYRATTDAISTPWVEQYLLSEEGIASMSAASPGSVDRNRTLSMAAFESIEVPVPRVELQRAVVEIARQLRRVLQLESRRDQIAGAILPAARNEIFKAMR